MSLFSLSFRELLSPGTEQELDQLLGFVSGYLTVEYNDDGTHADVTADAVTTETLDVDTITGPVDVDGRLGMTTITVRKVAVLNPAQITANQHNWDPTDASSPLRSLDNVVAVRIDSDAARSITGISAPSTVTGTNDQHQQIVLFCNDGNFSITFDHLSSSSTSANRVACPNGKAFVVPANGSVWLWYDSGAANWRIISTITASVSGTYTPTLTKVTNLSGTPNAFQCQYAKVDDVVTVSGRIGAEPTTINLLTELRVSLPVTSAISASTNVAGTATGITSTPTIEACVIEGDATNDAALMRWQAGATSDHDFFFTFTYLVQ